MYREYVHVLYMRKHLRNSHFSLGTILFSLVLILYNISCGNNSWHVLLLTFTKNVKYPACHTDFYMTYDLSDEKKKKGR